MYKLFIDKNKNFECNVKIEGADTSKSKVYLNLVTEHFHLRFPGSIKDDGHVVIPISKLANILENRYQDRMYLEVIAEDTYFIPYETEYITDKNIQVEVVVKQDAVIDEKPKVKMKEIKKLTVKDLANEMKEHNITIYNIGENMKQVKKIVESFHKEHKLDIKTLAIFIRDLPDALYNIS